MRGKGKSMRAAGFAKQRDLNEPEIVTALEAVGASVTRLNQLGVPDLLVGYLGATHLLEVKNGTRKLRDTQTAWFSAWTGKQAVIVTNVEEALTAIGILIVSPGMYTFCPRHGAGCRGSDCCCEHEHEIKTYPRPKAKRP